MKVTRDRLAPEVNKKLFQKLESLSTLKILIFGPLYNLGIRSILTPPSLNMSDKMCVIIPIFIPIVANK